MSKKTDTTVRPLLLQEDPTAPDTGIQKSQRPRLNFHFHIKVHIFTTDASRGSRVADWLRQRNLDVQIFSLTGPFDLLLKLEQQTPALLLLLFPMVELADFTFCRELRRNPRLKSMKVAILDKNPDFQERHAGFFFGVDLYTNEPLSSEKVNAIVNLVTDGSTI